MASPVPVLLDRPRQLAMTIAGQQAPDLRIRLPHWPMGVLNHLLDQPAGAILDRGAVLNALHTVVNLRILATYLEVKLLQRSRHWRGWLRQAAVGEILGVSTSGVTRRRQRLGRAIGGGRPIKISPSLPRVSRVDAEDRARTILDRRSAEQDEIAVLPDYRDLFGVVLYVLRGEAEVDIEVFVEDLLDCLYIVVSLRRQLDTLELGYLDLGRVIGVPNVELGAPFGRRDAWATWKARRRLANAAQHRGRHVVTADLPAADVPAADVTGDDYAEAARSIEARPVASEVEPELRALAAGLLAHEGYLAGNEELAEWLHWLREQRVHDQQVPLTPGAVGLLWTVVDEVAAAVIPDSVPGADELDSLAALLASAHTLRARLRPTRGD